MNEVNKIILSAVVAAALSGVGVFLSMRVEIAQLRERQALDYRELSKSVELMRMDLNGTRGEIMTLLRERSR